MKALIIIALCLTFSVCSYCQRYTTKGIEVYDKNLNGTYRLVDRAAAFDATFGFYKNNQLVKVMEGELVEAQIKKKVRTGKQTTYTINNYIDEIKIVVDDNGILTMYTDSQKLMFRIIKIEKNID